MAGLRRQDARALERLVATYGPLIAHWARAQGADAAEDVVQDVLFRVWRAGHRLDPDTHLPAWLRTVTQNAIRNAWRTSVRKQSIPVGLDLSGSARPATEGGGDPMDDEAERIAVEQVLDTLSPREREVLRLLYVADLPLGEVAERLQASREATKSLAARARRRAKERVQELLGAPAAAALPVLGGKAAGAAGLIAHAGLAAAASAAVAVLTAGALTLAGSGGAPAPAPKAPARAEATRTTYVPAPPADDNRLVVDRTSQRPARRTQDAATIDTGAVPQAPTSIKPRGVPHESGIDSGVISPGRNEDGSPRNVKAHPSPQQTAEDIARSTGDR